MSIPVSTTYPFPVQFFDDDGLPFQTDDCTITIQNAAGVVTSAAGTWDGDIEAFVRSVVVTAGVWYWYGETTDILASASVTSTGMIVVAGGASPTLAEIVAALSSIEVTIQSPVASDGTTLNLIEGDSYYDADGRAIVFDLGTPDYTLVGASAVLRVGGVEYPLDIDENTLTLELSAAETTAMDFFRNNYDIKITLANTHVVTPVRGVVNVTRSPIL